MIHVKNCTLWLLGCAVWLAAAPVQLPCPCGAGTIVACEKSTAPLKVVDVELAAKEDQPVPTEGRPDELLRLQACDADTMFLIFRIKVGNGRSLSKFDYVVETDTRQILPCLEMGRGNVDYFDFRLKAQQGPGDYRLVFACPKNVYAVKLRSGFQSVELPPVGDFVINPRPEGVSESRDKHAKDSMGAP